MRSHYLRGVEQLFGERTGFVAHCGCGWESTFHEGRPAAIAEAGDHLLHEHGPAPVKAHRPMIDLREPLPSALLDASTS